MVNTQFKTNDEQSKLGIAVVFTTNNNDPDVDDIRSFPGFQSQVYTLHVKGVTSTLTIKQLEEIGATIASLLDGPKLSTQIVFQQFDRLTVTYTLPLVEKLLTHQRWCIK